MLTPKGPCTQIVYTLAPKSPNRDYFKAKVCLFGYMDPQGTYSAQHKAGILTQTLRPVNPKPNPETLNHESYTLRPSDLKP